MKRSTIFAQVANSFRKVMQSNGKSLRFAAVLFALITLGVSNAWGEEYEKVSSFDNITTGDYVIIGCKTATSFGYLTYGTLNSGRIPYTETYTAIDELPSSIENPEGSNVWKMTVTSSGDNKFISLYNATNANYLASNNTNHDGKYKWNTSTGMAFTIEYEQGDYGSFKIYSDSYYLGINKAANYWRGYNSGTLTATNGLTLYKKAETTSSYTITAESNNTTYGTVTLDGTTITASPKTGYRVSTTTPYTVTSGTATVTNNGDNTFTVSASEDCTIQINFEAIPTHKIIFNTGGVTTITTVYVEEGATYDITQTPESSLTEACEYNTFVGWTTASSITDQNECPELVTSVEMETSDITLYAVYSKTEGGGGSTEVVFTDEDSGGWTTTAGEQTGTKSGVTISTTNGIYSKNNSQLRVYAYATFTITSTNTITSILFISSNKDWSEYSEGNYEEKTWTGNTNSVTFTAGNGQVRITQVTVTLAGGGTTTYSMDAMCGAPTYTVTYDGNGGETTCADEYRYEEGTEVSICTDPPTKTGYTFAGWTITDANSNSITPTNGKFTMPASNITLTAQWTANTYTVQFDANGGDGSMEDQSFTYDEAKALTANGFSKTDYTFTGWNTEEDGSGTPYSDQQTVSNLTAENDATVTLYAQWAGLYTVTFYNNGQEYATAKQTTIGGTVEMPDDPEACEGYVFDGWSENTVESETAYTKITSFTPTKNTILYAVYSYKDPDNTEIKAISSIEDITNGGKYFITATYEEKEYILKAGDFAVKESSTQTAEYNANSATEYMAWTFSSTGNENQWYIYNGSQYLATNNDNNELLTQTTQSYWKASDVSNATTINLTYQSYSRKLALYNGSNWRTYTSSSGVQEIQLYSVPPTLYTTSPACGPTLRTVVEEDIRITSAKGVRVDATQTLTIKGSNLDKNAELNQDNATANVTIKASSDNEAFKIKVQGSNGDGSSELTLTETGGLSDATFEKALTITYTPTDANTTEFATISFVAHRYGGTTEYATTSITVYGRSLPEQFVIAANTGDGWVALPNTLGSSSSDVVPLPLAIEVDDAADPTTVPLAPTTTIYQAADRSSVNDVPTGLRLTANSKYLQASTSGTNIWLTSNNSATMQSWTLRSTDFKDYLVRLESAEEGRHLSYSSATASLCIAHYKQEATLRFLHIVEECTQYAAPTNLIANPVRATKATLQWDAVDGAPGYEYRIGEEGEWQAMGDVTSFTITGLTEKTSYTIYVRASVSESTTNCSYDTSISFTTVDCDDVPYDISYASGANSITIYWSCKAETSTIYLYTDAEGNTQQASATEATSPYTFSGLNKSTTYYAKIMAGGTCASQIFEVSTERPEVDIVDWDDEAIDVYVNTNEEIEIGLENEVKQGSETANVATGLFFSKYFEAKGDLKMLGIYNGTKSAIDLTNIQIWGAKEDADEWKKEGSSNNNNFVKLSALKTTIEVGEEMILFTVGNYFDGKIDKYTKSEEFPDGYTSTSYPDNWYLIGEWGSGAKDDNEHQGLTFSGAYSLALVDVSGGEGNEKFIDIIGAGTVAAPAHGKLGANIVCTMDGNNQSFYADKGEDLEGNEAQISTNSFILIRKNSVVSGEKAVENNTEYFKTLGNDYDYEGVDGEWIGKSVCAEAETTESGELDQISCSYFDYISVFDYSGYYTTYNTLLEDETFAPDARNADGSWTVSIPDLYTYACKKLRVTVKSEEQTLVTKEFKVPIIISTTQTTKEGDIFTNLPDYLATIEVDANGDPTGDLIYLTDDELKAVCQECDIVVRDAATLTHVADGISNFRDVTIYPTGRFKNESTFTVNKLLIQSENDEVGYAIIENPDVTLTANAIAHTKRIDAQYWYPFALPYDCNIADITQANGESMGEYGVYWGIQYYDGRTRQEKGTSAYYGQSSEYWEPMGAEDVLKANQGYIIALFDASVQSATEMRTIYFPPAEENTYTESGTDAKTTQAESWYVNLEAEKRHHGWNFTATPYISLFNPAAKGIDDYATSEVLMTGQYDPATDTYDEDNNVYVSIPSPNGSKYYSQYLASSTSLPPFMPYFVQTVDPTSEDESRTLTYAKGGRSLPSSVPARAAATKQRVLVELNITAPDGQTDNTGVWVDERYTGDYEIAADLTKMYVAGTKPQLYTLDTKGDMMAYNALPDTLASNIPLGLYAPTAGEYTLSLNNRVSRLAGAESVELLHDGIVVANMMIQDYTIKAEKGKVEGYTLRIRRRAEVNTAVDNTTGNTITTIVNDGYISITGAPTDATIYIYDMVGHLMNMQMANGQDIVNMPSLPQGVYNIVIANDKGCTTIKSFLK